MQSVPTNATTNLPGRNTRGNMIETRSGKIFESTRSRNAFTARARGASVALARRALSEDLRAAGVFDYAVRDAALVVSELLSNAILHAYPLPGERLQVAWAVDGSSVEVAVSDGGSATVPHAGHPSLSAVSGRGLSIVAHLCQNWGVRTEEVGPTLWGIAPAPR